MGSSPTARRVTRNSQERQHTGRIRTWAAAPGGGGELGDRSPTNFSAFNIMPMDGAWKESTSNGPHPPIVAPWHRPWIRTGIRRRSGRTSRRSSCFILRVHSTTVCGRPVAQTCRPPQLQNPAKDSRLLRARSLSATKGVTLYFLNGLLGGTSEPPGLLRAEG